MPISQFPNTNPGPKWAARITTVFLTLVWTACGAAAREIPLYPYQPGSFGPASLQYINRLPVLVVEGNPEQLGVQQAKLTGAAAREVVKFPQALLERLGLGGQADRLMEESRALVPQIPPDHLRELEAFARTAGIDRDLLLALNTLVDSYRATLACSSIAVDPPRSATGGALLGRNLDFVNLGYLPRYSLVVVTRPAGKHAFVSVGFPGMLGCLSGMNDAGLALAVHEVFNSKDRAPLFNREGVPYMFCFRRVLEECATVEEAERLVRRLPRSTLLNLALCDRQGGAVLEITPRNVVLRRNETGICACTNHFRSETLGTWNLSWRHLLLRRANSIQRLSIDDIRRKLHQVNLGPLTMQTMIFETEPLVLHLAIGACPSSALPLQPVELRPLLATGRRSGTQVRAQ